MAKAETRGARWRRWHTWLIAALIGLVALLGASDWLFQRAVAQAPQFPFPACQKVWAHRGYAPAGGDNSLQGVQAAFDRGAAGVEIDLLFDRELDDFVVSHDKPYTLFDGQPLKLEAVLSRHGRRGFFWLDAKNLRKLPPVTAHRAVRRLAALVEAHGARERVVVESSNPLYLYWLTGRGIHSTFAVSPNDRKYSVPVYRLHAAATKLAHAFSGAGAISMDVARYTPVTAATYAKVPTLLSTVNDAGALLRLAAIPEVKVVLSDEDHYAISTCGTRPAP